MTLASEQAVGIGGRRRDRSYSDAHTLIHSKTHSSRSTEDDAPDYTTMGIDNVINVKSHSPSSSSKMTITKTKHHSHHHHHNHRGNNNNRPRSKSCDLHRHHYHHYHSAPAQKKTPYPHMHKYIPRTRSSGGHGERIIISSPANTNANAASHNSPKLKGHLWIRPDAAQRNHHQRQHQQQHPTSVPFIPALTGADQYPQQQQQTMMTMMDHGELPSNDFPTFASPSLNSYEDATAPRRHQVEVATNNNSTNSPGPTSFDDEAMMMLYNYDASSSSSSSLSLSHCQRLNNSPSASSDSYQQGRASSSSIMSGPASRIIFGESGKPIKPRRSFQHYVPSAATAL